MADRVNEEWALHAGTVVEAVWQTTLGGESLLSMHYWNGQQWVAMSGTMFPTTETTETLQCERCARVLDVHPEAEIPGDWLQVVLPCGAIVFCPVCIGEYGGSRAALKWVSDDIHRDKGGCPGCTA